MRRQKLRVAAVQMKFRPSIDVSVSRIVELIQATAQHEPDVMLFPECALSGYRQEFRGLDRAEVERACAKVA
jgi:predicted amidohydrolase